jgi:hypothetical protein
MCLSFNGQSEAKVRRMEFMERCENEIEKILDAFSELIEQFASLD